MDLRGVIEEYIITKVNTKKEKDKVKKLLLIDLDKYMKTKQIPYEIDIKSLQANKNFCKKITQASLDLLINTTNNKITTQKRILLFLQHLEKKYKLELEIDEYFENEAIDKYERRIDLLKLLNEGKTKEEIMNYYYVSRKPIEDNIRELVIGTKIHGQDVKIREIQMDDGEITYQSTIHPVFLPLNLTEVFYLLNGLKILAIENKGFTGKRYEHLANRVYCQLSNYAKHKIDMKFAEEGYEFPLEDECDKYNKSIDEESMAKENNMNKLMFLFKSGTKCNIELETGVKYVDCNIKLDISTNKVYVIHQEVITELNINEIFDINYDYE